jgi:1,4-dihydroxy-2-naphthoate polyprenyltransferase
MSLLMAYGYTGGPFPLAYKGLGDLFVILFFGLIAVGGVYFLVAKSYHFSAFIAGLQIGLLATVLIAINNLRDAEQDRLVNKRTFAVRFGARVARIEIAVLLIFPYFLNSYWYAQGFDLAFFLPLPSFFLAWKVIEGIFSEAPGPVYNKFLGQAAGVHLLFGILLSLGLWLSLSR